MGPSFLLDRARVFAISWLRSELRAVLQLRRGLLPPAEGPRELDRRLTRSEAQVLELERRLRQRNVRRRVTREGFRPDMTMDEVLLAHPGAARVLQGVHLPHCQGCAVRFDETLEEAALAYGLALRPLLSSLNALISSAPPERTQVESPPPELTDECLPWSP